MIDIKVFFYFGGSLQRRNPPWLSGCSVKLRDEGPAHVCARSLLGFKVCCIYVCVSDHWIGVRGVVVCRR